MRTFKEEQRFTQWWLYALCISIIGVLLIQVYEISNGFSDVDHWTLLFLYLTFILLLIGILPVKLHTQIDATGIKAQFSPFSVFTKKHSWSDIEECYVRKYSPLWEYGGWGIRGSAYNTSGNMGIQIITKDQKRFLIGTHKPEMVKRILAKYRDKMK
ncbi:MAG TPA: hypothetical protein VFI78_06710 [Salinimicrobium sp.]|nr:hypothetical protein [Salinimicrobium sp.]